MGCVTVWLDEKWNQITLEEDIVSSRSPIPKMLAECDNLWMLNIRAEFQLKS